MPPSADPATLLRRRPDIRVAERQLAANTALVGVAVGDLFPKVTFNGDFTYVAGQAGNLGDSSSRSYLIGPGISWAAFDIGRVRAQIAGARARTDIALATYEQSVLRALEDTENALVTHARGPWTALRTSLMRRRPAPRRRDSRGHAMEGGMVDFLEVLDAERTQLEAEDRLAQSRTGHGDVLDRSLQSTGWWLGAGAHCRATLGPKTASNEASMNANLATLATLARPGTGNQSVGVC